MGTEASLNGDNCYTSQTSAKQSLVPVPIFNALFDMNEFEKFLKENNYEDDLEFQLCDLRMAFNAGKELQWKPSGEQMEAFELFVRGIGESGYASPYDNNTKLLYSLLFDLKKLKEE